MSDPSNVAKNLRDRLGSNTEDRLGKALSELLESPLLTGAIGRAFDAREKATQAQEVALGALNIPTVADIERLTRRLRSVSHRLEGIEDGLDRLDRALAPSGVEARLSAIEGQLRNLTGRVEQTLTGAPAAAKAKVATGRAPAAKAQASKPRAKAPVKKASRTSTAKAVKAAKAAKAGTAATRRRPAA